MSDKITCGCGRVYVYDHKKGHGRTKCNSCVVNHQRVAKKKKCVTYKGGKCQNCGYDKCMRALEFHHRDPEKKEFEIGWMMNKSWKSLKKELDKCDLLCSNCHAEVEDLAA